ncbi:hypothetical protein HYV73_04680, partial [Candidatus Uhrbacteria bacterium]|nr:hypothetical protein [Candidatus Uhrbacteria bacterium]
ARRSPQTSNIPEHISDKISAAEEVLCERLLIKKGEIATAVVGGTGWKDGVPVKDLFKFVKLAVSTAPLD